MYDVHCHLDSRQYCGWEENIIRRAKMAGVKMITNSTGWKSSEKNIFLAQKFDCVWANVGLGYATGYKLASVRQRLKELAQEERVVGIGEAGLDYYQGIDDETKIYQRKLLEIHLDIAGELDLPIQIHNRNADEDILMMLNSYRPKGLMHCFTRNIEMMNKSLDMGMYISIGGLATYPKNKRIQEVARQVPDNRLLIETDSPYSLPTGATRSINEPENVKITVERMAILRSQTTEQIVKLTCRNTEECFIKVT
jgi:TatD DNase family protein